jgi:hypothetical protein
LPIGNVGVSVLNFPPTINPTDFYGTIQTAFNIAAIGARGPVLQVPQGETWKVLATRFTLKNNDAAFTVGAVLQFWDQSGVSVAEMYGPQVAKGATGYFSYYLGGQAYSPTGATVFVNNGLPDIPLRGGFTMNVFIDNNVSTDFNFAVYYYQYPQVR